MPDLAGRAAGAAEQAPADDQPGADAVGHLEVDEVRAIPPGAPRRARRARRGWRRSRRGRAGRGAPASRRWLARPTQPGRMDAEPTVPVTEWIGPGQAQAHAEHALAGHVRPGAAACARARRRRPGPRPRDSRPPSLASVSPRMACDRSATATARWRLPKSIPTAAPAEGVSVSSVGGRPAPEVRGAAASLVVDDEAVVDEVRRRSSRPSSATGPCGVRRRRGWPRPSRAVRSRPVRD